MISWKQLTTLGNKAKVDGGFSQLVDACHQLVSERGQANLYALAAAVVDGWARLQKDRYEAFFAVLATEFAPDQQAVIADANTYTADPTTAHLAA